MPQRNTRGAAETPGLSVFGQELASECLSDTAVANSLFLPELGNPTNHAVGVSCVTVSSLAVKVHTSGLRVNTQSERLNGPLSTEPVVRRAILERPYPVWSTYSRGCTPRPVHGRRSSRLIERAKGGPGDAATGVVTLRD